MEAAWSHRYRTSGSYQRFGKLVIGGEWEYQEFGILDETHLRFFTQLSIMRLFQGAGFAIQRDLSDVDPL